MSKTPAKPYQPTEREVATISAYETRRQVGEHGFGRYAELYEGNGIESEVMFDLANDNL